MTEDEDIDCTVNLLYNDQIRHLVISSL